MTTFAIAMILIAAGFVAGVFLGARVLVAVKDLHADFASDANLVHTRLTAIETAIQKKAAVIQSKVKKL